MSHEIDRLVAAIRPDVAVPPSLTPGARELLEGITASPRPEPRRLSRRRLPRRAMLSLAAGVAAVVTVLSWLLPGALGSTPAGASALRIQRTGSYYVVTVQQLFAAPGKYEKELRARGLSISLRVIPASPGIVGTVMPYDQHYNGLTDEQIARRPDLISAIQRPGACAGMLDGRCTIGLRIPVTYHWPTEISLGRKARPGEQFVAFGQLNNTGEPLQCERFVNRSVAAVRSMLAARGVTVTHYAVPLRGYWPAVPGSWYVHEGWLTEPGKALLVVDATPNPHPWSPPPGC